jgi:hypothetical protein
MYSRYFIVMILQIWTFHKSAVVLFLRIIGDRQNPSIHALRTVHFLHRTFKTHYKALCNKSEIIAGRSACTDSHSTESAIVTCCMPKFRKPRRNLIDLKNRRKVDFKVDYSSLRDPSNGFWLKSFFNYSARQKTRTGAPAPAIRPRRARTSSWQPTQSRTFGGPPTHSSADLAQSS